MTLVDIFKASMEKFSDRTCFIMRPRYRIVRWTYRDLYNFSAGMAQLLRKRGLKKGDRVLLLAPNSPWWQAAFWGCQLVGIIPVPLMIQSTPEFIAKVAKQTSAKILLKSSDIRKPHPIAVPFINVDSLSFDTEHNLCDFLYRGNRTDCADDCVDAATGMTMKEDDIAEILYTSGTTGEPKGVILSHKNIVSNLKSIFPLISVTDSDKLISILPLSHIFEQMVELRCLAGGGTIVYPSSLSSSAIMNVFREHKITIMATVPEFLKIVWGRIREETSRGIKGIVFRLLFLAAKFLPANARRIIFWPIHQRFGGRLRLIVSGGAALDPELGKHWQALGFKLLQGYGLTETSPVLTVTPISSTNIKSVGKVIPGVELKIAPDGEVLARGPNVFLGYYKNPAKTKEAFEGWWFKTGDMGYFDKRGFLYLTGRKKFIILTESGQNVYPEDIERELNKEKEVEDSCVVALKKEGRIEIHAVLLGKIADPEKVVASANKRLASFQQIQSWSVWPFSDLPRTVTRKVKRPEVLAYVNSSIVPESVKISKGAVSPLALILSQISGVSASKIGKETYLVKDLKMDSLGRIELAAQIEEKFGVEIDEAKIGYQTRVKDLEKLLQEKPKKKIKYQLVSWPRSSLVKALRPFLHKFIMFPLLWLFARVEVRGAENLQNVSLPCIFMANHLSDLDTPVMIKSFPANIRKSLAVAAATDVLYEKYTPLQPLATLFVNAYPFQRKDQIRSGLVYTGKLIDQGWSILIFPEGQISPTGKLLPLKKGAGLMAVEMGVPVVPVKITGTNKILPLHWRLPYPRKFRGRVVVAFGKPLAFYKKTSYEKAMKMIEKAMQEL